MTALLPALGATALVLPAASHAAQPGATAPAGQAAETTATAPSAPGSGSSFEPGAGAGQGATRAAPEAPSTPKVQSQHSQGATPGAPAAPKGSRAPGKSPGAKAAPQSGAGGPRAPHPAPSPATLTPTLPFSLQGSIAGVPAFFIESFRIPPFLLPVYQAAGAAYGVPWQVLAAVNEVETDYGRDLSVSSAGAEGWMQFLPSSWAQYGVDANGDGFKDPYNPADAVFAAARYLRAAGGQGSIRGAVFSYNRSPAYVESVMLRAQLLGGTPSELVGAITGLTEARFPVHAVSHFGDGFATVTPAGSHTPRTLPGTTIYSRAGAPVIAVQDGKVVQIGHSPLLGRFLALRDAFGNTYVYAGLGDVAHLYPVLQPHLHTSVSSRVAPSTAGREAAPSGPATAGAQPRSPISEGATASDLALGAAAALEPAPVSPPPPPPPARPRARAPKSRVFSAGGNDVYLRPLRAGVQVIAGTVLGHVGAGIGGAGVEGGPHMLFQIRPAGAGAPEIDPKPILDGWVALENSSIFHAKGENPFLATSPTVGQVLLESKQQLEPQVLHDAGVHLGTCGRQAVRAGRVDKRVLAMLEYLSVSGLRPTAAGLRCAPRATAAAIANAAANAEAEAVNITAVNGTPVAGHQAAGSIIDTAVRRLLMLQGLARPQRIVTQMSYPGAVGAVASPRAHNAIHVAFSSPGARAGRAAGLSGSVLTPSGWVRLIARLGEIPDPTVARAPSRASIPVTPASGAGAASVARPGGNH